jgi:hypothetical protein
VAVGASLEVLVIESGLASGNLDMVAPLAHSLRRLSLERCPEVVGELPSAPVLVAPRCMLSATVRLTKVPVHKSTQATSALSRPWRTSRTSASAGATTFLVRNIRAHFGWDRYFRIST